MIKISLNQIRLYAYHGIHPEEKTTGAEYELNMDVFFDPLNKISEIDQTIDYTVLYGIIRERMKVPAELLESVVQDIEAEVRQRFPLVRQINITISKINPPLVNFQGRLSVSLINDINR